MDEQSPKVVFGCLYIKLCFLLIFTTHLGLGLAVTGVFTNAAEEGGTRLYKNREAVRCTLRKLEEAEGGQGLEQQKAEKK